MVANDAIVKEAKQKAIEMLTQAQTRSKEIRGATNEYVDSLLNNAEKFFTNTLNDVNRTKQEINKVKKK